MQNAHTRTPAELDSLLHPLVKEWFYSQFPSYAPAQLAGVHHIHCRENILISASTGSAKTLTAFLAILNELVDLATQGLLEDKTYAIYISPLKALNYDIEHNLNEPLAQIEAIAQKNLGIRVGVRTGDTSSYQRQKMAKKPPHILITTPESFAIMQTTKPQKTVEWVIIDEIHALANNLRGTQLALSLENIESNPARIGLSATAAPLPLIAQYLFGTHRSGFIAKIDSQKKLDLQLLAHPKIAHATFADITKWSLDTIHDLIQSHRSTLVFTNTRSATERLVFTLKDTYPSAYYEINEEPPFERSQLIGAHHSSLPAEHRTDMENKLREGKMKCIVCSTSLELGIDIGYVDLVILLGSPKSTARLLQRIGRSGHKLNASPKGRIIVEDVTQFLECAAIANAAIHQKIDSISVPKKPFDILCQWIIATCYTPRTIDELFTLATQAYPFADMTKSEFLDCLDILSTQDIDNVIPKITVTQKIIQTKMPLFMFLQNGGTISDTGGITVKRGQQYLGTISEDFLELLKPGDIFILGGESYKFVRAMGMTAFVVDAHGRSPNVPKWRSQSLSLTKDMAQELQSYALGEKQISDLASIVDLEELTYVADLQQKFCPAQKYLVEQFVDGPSFVTIIHTWLGKSANEAIALFLQYAIAKNQHQQAQLLAHEYGVAIHTQEHINITQLFTALKAGESRKVIELALVDNEILKRAFRQCALRSLIMIKRYKGFTKRVGKQQFQSHFVYYALKKYDANNIILRSAQQQVLQGQFDVTSACEWIESILSGNKLHVVNLQIPTPYAAPIVASAYMDILTPANRHSYILNMFAAVESVLAGKQIPPFEFETIPKTLPSLDEELEYVIRRVHVPSELAYELRELIAGNEIAYSATFRSWIEELLSGAVPQLWSDRIIQRVITNKRRLF